MRGTDSIVDGRYVYWTWRAWDASRPTMGAICLRPYLPGSETLRRLCRTADGLGYGSLSLCNLFGILASSALGLSVWKVYADPVGPLNDQILFDKLAGLRVLECWGTGGGYRGRSISLTSDPRYSRLETFRVGTNVDGSPLHPYYRFDIRRFV